ncbi:MAG: dynamin family protein [Chromatiales bacterium]|nr:dynamin family protein [Chromatiales bacterium]
MEQSRLDKQLQAYEQWKAGLIHTVSDYRDWLHRHKLATVESEKRLKDCIAALDSDRLTIAFVAEFSRGKTELINAIFFADYGRRLLPSTAGRTTMCPTEMFYDHQEDQAYVRLLPIETRLDDATINELKKDKDLWITHPLDIDSADQVEECLQEVVQTRRATLEEAIKLGMYDPANHPQQKQPPTHVEIPKWRHALISFPHPLLKRGLNILDTPGLNALGSEPELTLNMLPSAQAVLFILAADAGVTRTDLEMWQNHIKGFHNSRKRGMTVVLNKVDTLWDDLKDEGTIHQSIEDQRSSTAKILGISKNAIFPVSAQKGLLAKIKHNQALLDKSALQQLENYLSKDILNSRQEIVQDTITAEISHMLENTRGIVATKLHGIKKQLEELRELSGKSQDVIEHMMARTREEQAEYMRNVNNFQASRKVLKEQVNILHGALDLAKLEDTITETRKRMSGNWTTAGLKANMRFLFDDMRGNMQTVVDQSEQARKLIRSIYRRFQNEHGFAVVQPKMFSIMRYRVELELLHQEAEIFRKSPVTTMTEKHFVVKRFFIAMVSRARDIFFQARQEIDSWLKTALEPLIFQIQEHKNLMERRLQDLQKVSRSRETLEGRITELQSQYNAIARQLTILRNLHNNLNNTRPIVDEERTRPRLISTRS